MKKIGICACYDTYNYGSMLQSLATQISIDNLGYDSEFIVYKKKKDIIFILKQIPRLLNKSLVYEKMLGVRKRIELNKHPEALKNNQIRNKRFEEFQRRYYKKFSDTYYGFRELCKSAEKYSSIVVGSDQLWSPAGLPTNFYNLMFVPEIINKVSYATSFGVSIIPWYQRKRTAKYLNRINYLSVREQKGAQIIKGLTGRDARVVLDPAMLLDASQWSEIIPNEKIVEDEYIFCYFLGENSNHRDMAEKVGKKTGLKIVTIPFLDTYVERDESFGDIKLYDVGPDRFINLIRNAKYIITDSFHGSVFSIIYHKQFVTLDRYSEGKNSRNSRVESLMNILGITERRVKQSDNIYEKLISNIKYEKVEQKLIAIRNESIEYLRNALLQGSK